MELARIDELSLIDINDLMRSPYKMAWCLNETQ